MTDKISSPSSASSGAHETSNGPRLTIVKQPPRFLFVEEAFEIGFVIEGQSSQESSPHASAKAAIQATLEPEELPPADASETTLQASDPPNSRSHKLEIIETRHASKDENVGKIRCRINLLLSELQLETKAYRIKLASDGATQPPTLSRPIRLVQAKLRVETTTDWSNIWYKDEGGRDKSMEIVVEAVDGNEETIKERLPLTLTLCYASSDNEPMRVINQDLLRVIGSEKRLLIDKSTGKAKIRFRIEDVSKNHQGQDFVLLVAVDGRVRSDIAPAYTPPVSIRSKRNKRHRTSLEAGQSMNDAMRGSPPSAISNAAEQHNPLALDGSDAESIMEAMHGIKKWADDVYNGLHSLQWQVLGYARNEDGSPDFSRPYHSMYNPNAVISRIRTTYMDTTRRQLQLLEQTICRSSASSTGASAEPYARPSPGMPHPAHDAYWAPHGNVPPLQPMIHPLAMQHRQGHDMNFEYPPPRGFYGQRPSQPHPMPGPRFDDTMAMQPAPLWHHQAQTPPRMSLEDRQAVAAALSTPPEKRPSESEAMERTEYVQDQVEYVLAKQYKSLHTRKKLGFPAYSLDKKLLGFFTSSDRGGAGHFVPVDGMDDFASAEVQQQATSILQDAIDNKSDTLYCLRDWGSLGNLLDRVFVYDWSKDIDTGDQLDSPLT